MWLCLTMGFIYIKYILIHQYCVLYKMSNSVLWYIFDILQKTNQWDQYIMTSIV